MRRSFIVGGAVLGLALGLASSATAQVTLGADAAFNSAYVWRGLSLTNNFVIQPDLYLTFPISSTALTVGGWANIEPSKYDEVPDDISEGGGLAGPDLTNSTGGRNWASRSERSPSRRALRATSTPTMRD
jgi:hypothetical protein